jgi:ketosteroid isomerase-like protein
MDEQKLQEMVDYYEICKVINRYCRAFVINDSDLLRSVYHVDGIDNHGEGDVPVGDFVDSIFDVVHQFDVMTHMMGQVDAEIDGDVAHVESHVLGGMQVSADGNAQKSILGGRYVDRFEKRDGEWRIAHRSFITDWVTSIDAPIDESMLQPDSAVAGR